MVIFKILRTANGKSWFQTYEVEKRKGMNVLDGLFDIVDNQDGSLSLRYSCRGAVCGSCAMIINGNPRLACKTQLSDYGDLIKIEPLTNLPIIKDLVVDMSPFYERYQKIKPYLITTSEPERERIQTQAQVGQIIEAAKCILCSICDSSCPILWTSKEYLGPASLTKTYRFSRDSRDEGEAGRLRLIAGEEGVWRCRTIFRCTNYCPKNIQNTSNIQYLKRRIIMKKF